MTRKNIRSLTASTAVAIGLAISSAAPAAADLDSRFADELHAYGIYGQRDYHAWLAKITCKRLSTSVDNTAVEAAQFLSQNLGNNATTEQTWQFLAAGIRTYCPRHESALTAAIDRSYPR